MLLLSPASVLKADGPLASLQGYAELDALIAGRPSFTAGVTAFVREKVHTTALAQAEPVAGDSKVAQGSRGLSKELS